MLCRRLPRGICQCGVLPACIHAHSHTHTHTHTHAHTPLAIFEVIQQILHLASSSFSEPLKNSLTWGRKGMSHTEVKILKVEKVHKCLSKMFIKKGQKKNHFTEPIICDAGTAKQRPLGLPGSLEEPPPCSSLLLCRAPFFFFLVFPSGLMFHWPVNVHCNYTDFPLLLCSAPSLYFLHCLHNSILYSKNKWHV